MTPRVPAALAAGTLFALACRLQENVVMAIDGRDIARARAEREAGGPIAPAPGAGDAYESRGVKAISLALFWVPVIFVLWLAYITGTWLGGGWVMGVGSVLSTLLTIVLLWVWGKRKKRR